MKEPFVPKSTISEMLPLSMRQEFFRRICSQVDWDAFMIAQGFREMTATESAASATHFFCSK